MTPKAKKIVALTRAVRDTFNRLKAVTDALHDDLGVTAAMRAVMESLHEEGPMTVPQIASSKGVTRQHIQMLVNGLCEAGLASVNENPAHRRSSLIALTEKGKRVFATMRAREAEIISELATGLDANALETATEILTRLSLRLEERLEKGLVDQ